MNLPNSKGIFLKVLIGCLAAAALLSVVTVLAGSFNEVFGRALTTILLVAVHALISFAFISTNEHENAPDELRFFTNSTFVVIVLSFITSIFGVWQVLDGILVAKLYGAYLVLLFAVLHAELLAKSAGKDRTIDRLVIANYVFIPLVVLMLLPVIFITEREIFGSFYYRLLAALGIVDATLTLMVVIMHKLYLQKHPETVAAATTTLLDATVVPVAPPKRRPNLLLILLGGYLILQVVGSLIVMVIGSFR